MMSDDLLPPVGHDRPFPWRCIECGNKEIYPLATDYTTTIKHDGRPYTIRIPDLEIPTCRKCGDQLIDYDADERIRDTLRAHVGMLTSQEINANRLELGMNQQELAEQLGVAKETISRWETGAIQSRAMDNLLRLFFESREVRRLLERRFEPDPPVPETPIPAGEVLFVDTNQYVGLDERKIASNKLLDSLEGQKAHIFVSAQIADGSQRNKLRAPPAFVTDLSWLRRR
jgi:putative zinc finger/helix-turn-helix YgiT family protein